ncbi:putative WD40/YVTN repeat-like-containing domain superfamily, WD40-repeat-containing [Dioscorea sansibarensis]
MVTRKEKAHAMDVNSVLWNPKNPRILTSASDDGTIKLWEVAEITG